MKKRAYYVDAIGGWYVVEAQNKRVARSEAVHHFGRGTVKEIRPASKDEVDDYVRLMGDTVKA